MKTLLIFIIGVGVGVVIIRYWFKMRTARPQSSVCMSDEEKIKQERKEKILKYMGNPSNPSGQVTNNDVEKLVGVSDATAERYLDELEKEGKIRQVGKTGVSVYYEKI